jgi:diguanylate cyclase (GGDEF)-like protein
MKLYAAMNRLFRRSYAAKLFAVAFVGTHIPLLALLGWSVWRGWGSDPLLLQVAILCLLATLGGTALTLYLLHGLLAPVRASAAALAAFDNHAVLPQLPEDGHDDAGMLMRGLNRSLRRIDDGIRKLEWTARHDALTGALNRHGGDVQLLASIAALPAGGAFTIAVLDMDALKQINDHQGHDAGDRALVRVVQELRPLLGPGDWVCRQGGDEFLAGIHAPALHVEARLSAWVASLVASDPLLRLSIGLAGYAPGDDAQALCRRADAAMYQAKRSRRGVSMEITA